MRRALLNFEHGLQGTALWVQCDQRIGAGPVRLDVRRLARVLIRREDRR